MEETSHIDLPLLGPARWIGVFLIILIIGVPSIFSEEDPLNPVVEHVAVPAMTTSPRVEPTKQSAQPKTDLAPFGERTWERIIAESQDPRAGTWDPAGSILPAAVQAEVQLKAASCKPSEPACPDPLPMKSTAVGSESSPASDQETKPNFPFDRIVEQAADRYQVDPALVRAIIMAESSYNPKAVSKKGAKGLMQLMPRTARALGVKNSFDPRRNIDAGVRYFRQLLDQFNGNVKLAIAAYNAGSRTVKRYKGIPPFKRTQYYVAKVIEYHRRYQE